MLPFVILLVECVEVEESDFKTVPLSCLLLLLREAVKSFLLHVFYHLDSCQCFLLPTQGSGSILKD